MQYATAISSGLQQMNVLGFTAAVLVSSLLAGFVGSLTGLGGGVVLTPILTLFLGVDIRYAIGASLISVIATSSGSAAAYVRDGFSNIRVGMFLEIATTCGALFGAFLATKIPTTALSVLFGFILLQTAWQASRERHAAGKPPQEDPLAHRLGLHGSYQSSQGLQNYVAERVKTGFSLMFGAGTGSLKVIAIDQVMRLPFKVSTATSNFMIGVTAAASASVYLSRGYIDPTIAMPVMIGVLAGSTIGARYLAKLRTATLRRLFALLVAVIGIQMIVSGLRGQI